MNVLKALKVSELRKKLSVIPAKLIIALLFTVAIRWDTDIETVISNVKTDPKGFFAIFFIVYGAISYVYFFIRLMHNWIFGIIISAGVAALVYTQVGKLGEKPLMIALAVMLIGGPVMDLINLLRYRTLKNEVIRAEEERGEAYYDDGYEDGYRKGIREGKRDVRRVRREYESMLDESRERDRLERSRGRDQYLEYDEYEDEYDEDYYEEYDDYSEDYDDGYDEDYDDGYGEDGYGDTYDDRYGRKAIGYDDNERMRGREYEQGDSSNAVGFFADCKSPSAIKRRYHELSKVYHPDSGNGSAEIFYAIKQEYDRLSRQ